MENQFSLDHAIDLYNDEKYEEAIQIAMPFINCDERARFVLIVSAALSRIDRKQDALPYLEQAVMLLPISAFATNSLYLSYMELGFLSDGFDEMERYIRIHDSLAYEETIIGYVTAVGYNFDVGNEAELIMDVKTDIRHGTEIIWPELRRRILLALRRRERQRS